MKLVSSVLLSVEGRRAAGRYGKLAGTHAAATATLTRITLLALDQSIIDIAGELQPQSYARSTHST